MTRRKKRVAPDENEGWREFQHRLGYEFTDPAPLVAALTSRSWHNEARWARSKADEPYEVPADRDMERLEFLGDAVLQLVTTEWLFRHGSGYTEGMMSRLRSQVVRAAALSEFAKELRVADAMRVTNGERTNGHTEQPAVLADTLEAVLGAAYLDGGIAAVRTILLPWLGAFAFALDDSRVVFAAKNALQERTQKLWKQTPTYRLLHAEGPAHAPTYEVEVSLGDRALATGTGSNRQAAENRAALLALSQLGPEA